MRIRCSFFAIILILFTSCKNSNSIVDATTPKGYQGQAPSPIVPTVDKPVQRQWKGIWSFEDESVFFSNDFDSARLNGVASDGNNHFTIWITAENTPINVSPWYSFKVWSKEPKEITIKLSYQDSRSRYYPKLSRDGLNFDHLIQHTDNTELKKNLQPLRDRAIAAYEKSLASKNFDYMFWRSYDEQLHNQLLSLSNDPQEQEVLQQLWKTKEIYGYNSSKAYYKNNHVRGQLMRTTSQNTTRLP
nr:M14-type cytosolic carboxypeptidase [uncultured Allomuricauda sp.]